jgi:hypothetical protein
MEEDKQKSKEKSYGDYSEFDGMYDGFGWIVPVIVSILIAIVILCR